ncbi:MAG: hypothetical protein IPM54_24970 [Polyangiaceae bacterium]|nr:hypothetical protein [Polyangiaceae bacterium]
MTLRGLHSSKTGEWWTPLEVVDPARELFGGFGLDPASCAGANRIVGARRFFGAGDDGLSREWRARIVWCNPPRNEAKRRRGNGGCTARENGRKAESRGCSSSHSIRRVFFRSLWRMPATSAFRALSKPLASSFASACGI